MRDVYKRQIQASSGATIDFSATAKYNGISLYADDTSFTWELTGDIGTCLLYTSPCG